MDKDEMPQNPFSLIADFEGDITELFNKPFEGPLPILPLRNMMLFPGVVAPVSVGREASMKLVSKAAKNGGLIGVACQRVAKVDTPKQDDLYPTAVLAQVMRLIDLPDESTSVILQSYGRIHIDNITRTRPYLWAEATALEETLPDDNDKVFQAICDTLKERTISYLKINELTRDEAVFAVRNIKNPIFLVNFVCANLPFSIEEKAKLLGIGNVKDRALELLKIINRETQYALLKHKIQIQTREELDQQQKEYFLQQQIKNLQDELGNRGDDEIDQLVKKADELGIPEPFRATFDKEIKKLERINPQTPDYNVQLTYLQTFVSLPWGKKTDDDLNINHAKNILNRDHYGMEKVKERILEQLAIMRYSRSPKSPIICLYGPPGVGKTSLGRSIADALKRRCVRISLGGLHDEAEIRGHRRTYVAAMPGRIMKSLIKAETDNPVFILDEIDKVSANNYNGDPQSALLEVLDPEQNKAFHDNFLDIDYDLSQVLFIATANTLSTIPPALLDRMELIEVEGYLTEEKKEIARRHLLPKELKELSFESHDQGLKLTPAATEFLIERYTRESGVRQLSKQINKLIRKYAYQLICNDGTPPVVGSLKPKDVEKLLGNPPFSRDKYQGNKYAGVVTGLAWTSVGGEILFIETSLSRSKAPRLTITGNLGDVMKESAILALEYVKAHADTLKIDYRIFEQWSIHIHVPEGATPKDGPSAGITIATSLASALTQRRVRDHIAMTGEITLRGKVLPVGGIKEKILAAKRAGITDIILSNENKKDIEEINEQYVQGLTFHYVENVENVWNIALLKEKVSNPIEFKIEEAQPEKSQG